MRLILAILLATIFISCSRDEQIIKYPAIKKINVVDTYFGFEVQDPYRWLENDTAREVSEWVSEQNKLTFGYLEKIPFRGKVKERLTKIWDYPKYSAPWREGTNYYFSKNDGLQNQWVIYKQRGIDSAAEVFLDPNTFSVDGTVALSGLNFSADGKYAAYSVSQSGSDWQKIYVMDVETKKRLPDEISWVKFSGPDWYKDGFFYSQYDAPPDTAKAYTERNENHKVYYHKLGASQSEDILVHQDPVHPLRLLNIGLSEDKTIAFLSVFQKGSKGSALYCRPMTSIKGSFKPILETFDDNIYPVTNVGTSIIAFTDRGAPRGRLILIDLNKPAESDWKTLVPEKSENLGSVRSAGGKLFLTYLKDVVPYVYLYGTDGNMEHMIELPEIGTVSGFSGKEDDSFVFYTMTSFTTPSNIYKYEIESGESSLFRKAEIDFAADQYETKQVFFPSKDSVKIPMFIVHRKGIKLDGSNPVFIYGYGGFNDIVLPQFSVSRLVWLEQGGIYASVNLRGGSEYGEEWHESGMKLKKQNVFNDFIAAAEFLIREGYTSPQKMVISGVSNGGLLIGAVINQRPDLFRVAIPRVGVMDMLRFHKFTIGWAWVSEYGSSDDSADFRNLYAYSPIHNLTERADYPAVLVTTADHDDRVVPAHSFKYIATLQGKNKGNNPTLIRIETKAGHGGGKPTTKIIEETADIYSFAFYNLGIIPKY